MEISAINPISPKEIDWRRLTAKEIIKYEESGINVPEEYLSWAKEFQTSLTENDNDNTTYEKAVDVKTEQKSESVDDNVSSPDDIQSDNNEQSEEENLTPAELKRKQLTQDGYGLLSQGIIFLQDSNNAGSALDGVKSEILNTENLSKSELADLENYINQILPKAKSVQNELKSEVEKINNNRSNLSTFGKINKLQKELEKYGNDGQAHIAGAEADFNSYQAVLDSQSTPIFNAKDTASETLSLGSELIAKRSYFWFDPYWVIGKADIRSGTDTGRKSFDVEDVQQSAISVNKDNMSNIPGFKNDVKDKTGVDAVSIPAETTESDAENASKETLDSKQNSEQNTKNGSDTENKQAAIASGNMDEILKYKIRKGEDINPELS